jgi:chemotaxis protein methyltransferase CheR
MEDQSRGSHGAASTDAQCKALLAWALPRLGLRWAGFRNVRGQVQKRVLRRMRELGLADVAAYRQRLESDPDEWHVLYDASRVTISRFFREREVWDGLRAQVLPALIAAARERGATELRCWSAGCASGEEPHSLALLHGLGLPAELSRLPIAITASDADERVLERARRACYDRATLRELPQAWIEHGFTPGEAGQLRMRDAFRERVTLRREDLSRSMPEGPFDLVLCRNLVLTYFDAPLQREVLTRVAERTVDGGALVVGKGEQLPDGLAALFEPWPGLPLTFRRAAPTPRR